MEDPRRRLASPGTNIEDRLEAELTRGPRIEPARDLEREEDLQAYRDVVHRSGQIQRVPHRPQRSGAVPDRAPASGRAAHLQRLPTRHAEAAVLGRPAGAQPATLHITADAEIPDGGAEGLLLCHCSNSGGWSLYVKDGKLRYARSYVGRATYQVRAPDALPTGKHRLRFEFEPTGQPDVAQGKGTPGRTQLYVDGQLIAQTAFPVTTPVAFNPGGLTCGAPRYAPPASSSHRSGLRRRSGSVIL